MVEDYRIFFREGRSEPTGEYEITKRGTQRRKYRYVSRMKTPVGVLLPEVWKQRAMAEIEAAGEMDLLERIKEYCRERCGWLRKEAEVEEYAIECLCERAYRYWEDFEDGETIIWM